jgi:hypothetical protein
MFKIDVHNKLFFPAYSAGFVPYDLRGFPLSRKTALNETGIYSEKADVASTIRATQIQEANKEKERQKEMGKNGRNRQSKERRKRALTKLHTYLNWTRLPTCLLRAVSPPMHKFTS